MSRRVNIVVASLGIAATVLLLFFNSKYHIIHSQNLEYIEQLNSMKRDNTALATLNKDLNDNLRESNDKIEKLEMEVLRLQPITDDMRFGFALKEEGYKGTVGDIASALRAKPELIPIPGILGGTMAFTDIDVLSHEWIYAEFEDGHTGGAMLLRYDIEGENSISFKVFDSYYDGEVSARQQALVEELITNYFSALETQDYGKAFRMQAETANETLFIENWQSVESIKLLSVNPYVYSHDEGISENIPEGKYTTKYFVELEIKVNEEGKSAWTDGIHTRFVSASPSRDGIWHIQSLATSP